MSDSRQNYVLRLRSAAGMYRNRGWSVVPIRGNLDLRNPKAAVVEWAQFQQRLPGNAELDEWFLEKKYQGLAIVCGAVSSLAVLDFDDSACAEAFARVCPDLTNTFTVQSGGRELPHYYYHVPDSVHIQGKRTVYADFQAGGTYVVAPPTCIENRAWTVANEADVRSLNAADAERIGVFLDAYAYYASGQAEQKSASESGRFDLESENSDYLPAFRLSRFYTRLASQVGRNNALFRAASFARDHGWSRTAALEMLLDLHVVQPSNGTHAAETLVQRRREGQRTIANAFRYASRSRSALKDVSGLPNAVREALLQNKQAAVARVLDGLLMAGVNAGAYFTERAACQLLRIFRIGRRAVMSALKAVAPNREALFLSDAPQTPQTASAHAAERSKDKSTKCIFVRGAKRVKSPGMGRVPRRYRMPDRTRLYRLLDVRPSISDVLMAEDLYSPEAYRRALQRAFVQRRPGQYSRRWLAARLGISVWTSRRYDRQIGVLAEPIYEEQRVTWGTLKNLPLHDDRLPPDGTFLESDDGKCYPPVRGLAAHLLRQHRTLIFKRRVWNYYRVWHQDYDNVLVPDIGAMKTSEPPAESECEFIHNKIENRTYVQKITLPQSSHEQPLSNAAPVRQFWLCPECRSFHVQADRPPTCEKCGHDHWELIPESIWQDAERCKAWWQSLSNPRQGSLPVQHKAGLTPAQEALANRIYERVGRRTPEHALTRTAARQLVAAHDSQSVESALDLLRRRRSVRNAAGFVITLLRGQAGSRAGQSADGAEDHAAWVERLKQSPYAHFYANAHQLLNTAEYGENDNVAGDGDATR